MEKYTGIRASVNIFRHARINHEFDKGNFKTGKDILKMSDHMDHSVDMLLKYN